MAWPAGLSLTYVPCVSCARITLTGPMTELFAEPCLLLHALESTSHALWLNFCGAIRVMRMAERHDDLDHASGTPIHYTHSFIHAGCWGCWRCKQLSCRWFLPSVPVSRAGQPGRSRRNDPLIPAWPCHMPGVPWWMCSLGQ